MKNKEDPPLKGWDCLVSDLEGVSDPLQNMDLKNPGLKAGVSPISMTKEEGGAFWKKVKNSKLTAEEFERVEALECCIIDCENRIDECKKEIQKIMKEAKKR